MPGGRWDPLTGARTPGADPAACPARPPAVPARSGIAHEPVEPPVAASFPAS